MGGGKAALLITCHSLSEMMKVQRKIDLFNTALERAQKPYCFGSEVSENNIIVYKSLKAAS
jgi:hypothetical protein